MMLSSQTMKNSTAQLFAASEIRRIGTLYMLCIALFNFIVDLLSNVAIIHVSVTWCNLRIKLLQAWTLCSVYTIFRLVSDEYLSTKEEFLASCAALDFVQCLLRSFAKQYFSFVCRHSKIDGMPRLLSTVE